MRLRTFLRATSSVVLVTFTSMFAQPTVAALQQESRPQALAKRSEPTADERYAKLLGEVEEQSKKAKRNRGQGKSSKEQAKEIRRLERELVALERDLDKAFAATEKHLNDKNLAEVIKQRHRDAVATYGAKRDEFKALVTTLGRADDRDSDTERDAALASLTTFFERHPQTRRRAPFDPNNLAWRTPKATVRPPIIDPKRFAAAKFGQETVKVAGSASGSALPKLAPAGPTAEDLAETEDVQISPPIRAKAQELGNQPLQIYLWVTNNIRFVPTYGSIQGSQDTLEKRAGNAFDTASLLIALLRAAGIPARYSYTTIEVPTQQAMNWMGGVTRVEAALRLLAQGGIPSIAVVEGGTVKAIRMEHIHVDAWVDFAPSRGGRMGPAETWIPLDASYKQYVFTDGMNLGSNVALDAPAITAALAQGATFNTQEGWVQNISQSNVQALVSTYKSQLKDYVDSRRAGATLGEVAGTDNIREAQIGLLAGTLPYRIVAKGPKFSTLPATLRHQFRYSLYSGVQERANDEPLWVYQSSLPSLAGKKLTLAFRPAAQADEDLIYSFFPRAPQDGSPVQLTDLPSSVPAYARVICEFYVDGVLVHQAGPFALGAELAGRGGFTHPDFSGWDSTDDDTLVAGQTTSIGLSLQGLSKSHLEKSGMALAEIKRILSSASPGEQISGGRIVGELLGTSLWAYFASLQTHGDLAQRLAGVIDVPGLSYGLMHGHAQPMKLFGVVTTSVKYAGVLADIGHLRHIRASKEDDLLKQVAYNRMRGQVASLLEGAIPERFFADPRVCAINADPSVPSAGCPDGASAVKAVAIASAAGQKIFTLTRSNAASIDQLQLSGDVVDLIGDAVSAGKEVIAHERPISVAGWTGAGVIIVDPETGAGAYLIDGGANGDWTRAPGLILGLVIALAIASLFVGPFVLLLVELTSIGLHAYSLFNLSPKESFNLAVGELIGLIAGLFLAVFIGGLVSVTVSTLTLIGLGLLCMIILFDLFLILRHAVTGKRLATSVAAGHPSSDFVESRTKAFA